MEQVVTQHNTISDNINANHHHDPTNNNAIRASPPPPMVVERRARPQKDQNLNCPRCNSTNTKFCYYNNYSLTQPRYFCKSCRRYWTHGGSLRNVPMGGGSRRNRRSSTSSSTLAQSSSMNVSTIPNKVMLDLNPPSSLPHLITPSQNPKFLEGQDLNLGFPIQGFFQPLDQHQLPKIEASNNNNNNNNSNNNNNNVTNNENNEPIHIMNINIPNASTTTSCTTTSQLSCGVNSGENNNHNNALELLRTGIASTKGSLSSFVPMPLPDSNTLYPQLRLFSNLQEVKQSTTLGVFASNGDHNHHHGNNGYYEHMVGSGANARLLFPFVDMNKLANSTPNHHHHHEIDEHNGRNEHHHHHNQAPTSSYWTSMLGGGTW